MASSISKPMLLLVAFAAASCSHLVLPVVAAGSSPSSFLGPSRTTNAAREAAKAAREDHLRHTLTDHLTLLLLGIGGNSSSISGAVSETEQLLSPIIAASPKNEHGNLNDASARYALHRLFMERHGWHFKIFETPDEVASSSTSNSSSIFSFQGHLPNKVRDLLESQFQRHHGYGRLELALFAAAVEHVIFAAVPSRLVNAYGAKGVGLHDVITIEQARDMVDLHMAAFITNYDLSIAKPVDVFKLVTNMAYVYDDWEGTRGFFRSIEASFVTENGEYRFGDISKIVSQIEKEFVHWNNHQCMALKEKLLSIETQSSGRVRLLDFYDGALYHGMDSLVETQDYLRQLGDLDESDPLEPRVIISNYRDGPNSCVAMTSFYSVCCVDECADLYGHLEKSLGKPEATPSEILPIIQTLSSPSMDSCRSVADTLERRLQEIANENNGVVSLHGPEFAEWMHFVYPSECTQASLFGPARHLTVDEWDAKNPHLGVQASTEQMREYSAHLGDMARAKRTSSVVAKDEWDVAASASWLAPEEASSIEPAHRLRRKTTGDKVEMAWPLVLFVAVAASLPALVMKILANHNEKLSSECSKSHVF